MMTQFITSSPTTMSGVPVIRNTRVPLSRIVFLLSEGHTLDSIGELYPQIDKNILKGAVDELIANIDSRQYEAASVEAAFG